MCDYDDDFEGFDEDGLFDEEPCEADFENGFIDDLEGLKDDFADRSIENDAECDDFSGKDAFYLGSAMGWAYEEGLQESRRQQTKRRARKRQQEGE